MEINRKIAIKKWEEQFGKAVSAVDFAGRKIQKGALGQLTSAYGWTLTYILPKSEGGKAETDNLICVHVKTNNEKDTDFPSFCANDIRYKITNENGSWEIVKSEDADAIAEQKEKTDKALDFWTNFFGDIESATDFAGRTVNRYEFGTNHECAWKIAPYVESKPTENKNAYIANLLTIEEALGKTAFKANGKSFTLNKENSIYTFNEVKPLVYDNQSPTFDFIDFSVEENAINSENPKKLTSQTDNNISEPIQDSSEEVSSVIDNISEPIQNSSEEVSSVIDETSEPAQDNAIIENNDDNVSSPSYVAAKLDKIIDEYRNPETSNTWLDFIVIHAVTNPGTKAESAIALTDSISTIISEAAGHFLSLDVSELIEDGNVRNMFFTYRFISPKTSDMERLFNTAMLLNTYANLFIEKFGLISFKIYNYACVFETAHINYSFGMLVEYNTGFKTFMNTIFSSPNGFYEGESKTTLYISDVIVFNVPGLSEMHGEGPIYRTDARLVEHNFVFGDIKEKLNQFMQEK